MYTATLWSTELREECGKQNCFKVNAVPSDACSPWRTWKLSLLGKGFWPKCSCRVQKELSSMAGNAQALTDRWSLLSTDESLVPLGSSWLAVWTAARWPCSGCPRWGWRGTRGCPAVPAAACHRGCASWAAVAGAGPSSLTSSPHAASGCRPWRAAVGTTRGAEVTVKGQGSTSRTLKLKEHNTTSDPAAFPCTHTPSALWALKSNLKAWPTDLGHPFHLQGWKSRAVTQFSVILIQCKSNN